MSLSTSLHERPSISLLMGAQWAALLGSNISSSCGKPKL